MKEGVGENVGVHSDRVTDFISSSTTTAFGVRGVVETIRGKGHDELAVMNDALKFALTTVAEFQFLDGGDGLENSVIHGDVDEGVLAEDPLDFANKGGGPGFVGTSGGSEHKASVLEVLFQVFAFLAGEIEVIFTGHNDEGKLEEFVTRKFDRFETAFGFDGGFLLDQAEEFVAKTTGGFCAGVDEVAASDSPLLGSERPGGESGRQQ